MDEWVKSQHMSLLFNFYPINVNKNIKQHSCENYIHLSIATIDVKVWQNSMKTFSENQLDIWNL